MALNSQQKSIVDALHGTVNVMAGAGTGKTFTLTQRIVAAVADCISRGESSPMDRIMAITFTEPAAAELKSRVRTALFEAARNASRNDAQEYLEAALNVDNSWISTIDAMAGRILRENAIEFGIDPNFHVAKEAATEAVLKQAFERALTFRLDDGTSLDERLLNKEPAFSNSPYGTDVYKKIVKVLEKSKTMPKSLEGVVLPEGPDPKQLLSTLVRAGEMAREHMREDGWTEAAKRKADEYASEIDSAIQIALSTEDAIGGARFLDNDFPMDEYMAAVYSFPPTSNKFGNKIQAHAQAMLDYREAYRKVSDEVCAICGLRRSKGLLNIASDTNTAVQDLIQTDSSTFEFNEVLRRCLAELEDPKNVTIVQRYRDQFDFIMVDEFQDTNKLQMRIIEAISREMPDGQNGLTGLGNVCTVGDMQQSIYRFRGGDVEESVRRVESLRGIADTQFELSCNYRSHADILQVVEEVFSQDDVFGDEFLSLSAAREKGDELSVEIFADQPRIEFDLIHATKKDNGTTVGVSKEEVSACAAMDIAERFKHLADAGVPLSKMALLLGQTGNAGIYVAALRSVGLESVMVGGSVFNTMPEAHLASTLLNFAADPADEVTLVECLTSPLFAVSDDALLAMVTSVVDGKLQRSSIGDAYKMISKGGSERLQELDPITAQALRSACELLSEFVIDSVTSASGALRKLIADSGYLMRLEAEGDADSMASAGNLVKAVNIVESLEESTSGKCDIASAYSDYLQKSKESPGILSTTESDYVQIMTVHKSKGLEFDHVAVAELNDGIRSSSAIIVENIDDETFIAQPGASCDFANDDCQTRQKKLKDFDIDNGTVEAPTEGSRFERNEAFKEMVRSAKTPFARLQALKEYSKVQELEEARRLLYVAMTRARESLLVASAFGPGTSTDAYSGIFSDVANALTVHFNTSMESLLEARSMSSNSITFKRRVLVREEIDDDLLQRMVNLAAQIASSDDEDAEAANDTEPEFEVPIYAKVEQGRVEPFQYNWLDVESYSSLIAKCDRGTVTLSHFEDDAPIGSKAQDFDDVDADETSERSADPTALGTAFHRLMQLSIENALVSGADGIDRPSAEAIEAQASLLGLTHKQEERLQRALDLMFNSKMLSAFETFGQMGAEVPFCVNMNGFYLQGEIDALADDGNGHAMLLDYKTGYAGMTDESAMRKAHEMQAMCYAYALLSAGFESVVAYFIHVETPSPEDPSSAAIVKYSFENSARQVLYDAITSARVYA